MALSFSRPDPSQPSSVSSASFALSRRGFDQAEVRDFLRMVAAELARLQERERFLEHELRVAQRSGPSPVAALDEEVVTRLLGEEAARILQTARDGAAAIRQRAEEHALRLVREANEEAHRTREEAQLEASRLRQDAATDAESELAMAKQHGREMVVEVRAYRERVLGELARRRELAREQIEQLAHGRDRLVQAFERARLAAVDVLGELTPLIEPDEYVNLSPTTGPVPLMVPNTPAPPQRRGPAFAEREPSEQVDIPVSAAAMTVDEVPVAPTVEGGARADRVPTDDVATPALVDEASGRIFDVEVDDPELASAADPAPTPTAAARRVPGVIDRPATEQTSESAVDAADVAGGPDAATDPTVAVEVTSEVIESSAETTVETPVAPSPVVEPPTEGDTADSTGTTPSTRKAGQSSRSAKATTADTTAPVGETAAPATTRGSSSTRRTTTAPLPRETVVERPAADQVVTITPDVAPDPGADLGAHPDEGHDRPLAPVVSIFGGAAAASTPRPPEAPPSPAAPAAPSKTTVDDLFAKLRAARTDTVAEQATAGTTTPTITTEPTVEPVDERPAPRSKRSSKAAAPTTPGEPEVPTSAATPDGARPATRTSTARVALFEKSPDEPVVQMVTDDSIFGRREELVVPLIVNAAKKLKRVLADEQNDVLAVLRRKEAVRVLDALVPSGAEHIARYTDAIAPELLEAALGGAASIDRGTRAAHEKSIAAGGSVKVAAEMLADRLIDPMRERLDRAVADAAGSNTELAEMVRHIYREWKTQYIDTLLDEVVRLAFGHGALSAVAPGTPLCWAVDPNGPACADGDDNALGGAVSAGQPFPTEHLCAPAHAGCRCMLVKAQR